jgi:hypothetical protein
MKSYSGEKQPTYWLIGPIVRVHWDHKIVSGDEYDQWEASEAAVPNDATPEEALALGVPPAIAAEFKPENFTPNETGEQE